MRCRAQLLLQPRALRTRKAVLLPFVGRWANGWDSPAQIWVVLPMLDGIAAMSSPPFVCRPRCAVVAITDFQDDAELCVGA